jgi:ribosomal protein S18 acetylase RimI-like enzyme
MGVVMQAQTRFRSARKEDCRAIAELYRISSDGVADYIWQGLAEPGEEHIQVGERRYAREDTVFSYINCTVAERRGEVTGMLVAFPVEEPDSDMGGPDEEVDPVLKPYSELERPGSFYICGMALLPEYRGQGLGTRMLELARQQACQRGLDELSLIVFEQNAGAKRLYERYGFREVDRRPVVPHELIHYAGDALLMVAGVR